jgi:hypothetical protein
MKNNLIFLTLLIFSPQIGFAQDWVFEVLTSNFKATVKAKDNYYDALSFGKRLKSSDKLRLLNKNYLILWHKSGKILEISADSGIYSIAKIEQKLMDLAQTSPNEIYFTWGQKAQLANNRYHQPYRSVCRCIRTRIGDVYLPLISDAYQLEKINITWSKAYNTQTYQLKVKDNFGEVIMDTLVQDTTLHLNLKNLLKDTDQLIFDLKPLTEDFRYNYLDFSINFFYEKELNKIKQEFEVYQKELEKFEDLALQKLLLAKFFEAKGCYYEAMELYKEAYMKSKNPIFETIYHHFLVRREVGNAHRVWR